MCGIVGFQGEYDERLVAQMTRAVAHRGPDGAAEVVRRLDGQPPTGLGHRRLAIIDLSDAGLQPMTLRCGHSAPGDLTLIFNGEIYNFRELRADLESRGHHFFSHTDSEVLLHLYEEYGVGMLNRLNGMFAFAIHDARPHGRPDDMDRGALFLARDQMGVKPLYVAETPSGVVFGSEIKALVQAPDLDRSLDLEAVHQTLAYLWTPAPRTALRGVEKIEPGTAVIISRGRLRRRWSYYTPPYTGHTTDADPAHLAEELAHRVSEAVTRQLVADVPVGAFLSGGLDSSAVVAMMRRAWPDRPITAFTVALDADPHDGNPVDLPYARKAAAHLGVSLEEVRVPASSISRLGEMVWLLDEPQADPAPINALLIAEAARARGIPVLLSGAGGDDILGGYGRHWALSLERRWAWWPQSVRDAMQRSAQWAAGGQGYGQSIAFIRRLAKAFAYAGEGPDRRLVSHFLWSTDGLRRSLYTDDMAQATAAMDVRAPLLHTLARIPAERDRLQRMLMLETVHFLADHNLNYTDRAGMAVGVEVRVPLLDLDLVRFAATVPSSLKQAGRMGKPLFRTAMEPWLPRDVIYRGKTGFGAPLRRWLRHELRELVLDTLSPETLRRRGLFAPAAVARLIDRDRRGMVDGSYTIFALLSLELWSRAFLDRHDGPVPLPSSVIRLPSTGRPPSSAPLVPASSLENLKASVETLPEPVGRVLARVPFAARLGPQYVLTRRAIARAERPGLGNHDADRRWRRLCAIVAHAEAHSPFYRAFYRRHGFSAADLRSPHDWHAVPIVTRADLQTVSLDQRITRAGGIRLNTGGTSGDPLDFMVESRAFAREWAHMHAIWMARGYHWRDVKITLRGKHFDPSQPLRFNAVHNEFVANAGSPMAEVVAAVLALTERVELRWVHGYPSLVAEFAHTLLRWPARDVTRFRRRLRGVLLGSEYPTPVYRSTIEGALSTNVVTWYGHSEMAVLARETALDTYASLPTYGLAEAVPADEGAGHRLVCTALANTLHPFVRYDTGDRVDPVDESDGILRFRISDGRVGEFVTDRRGRRHSLTAIIFGRHHQAFAHLRHVQVRDLGQGRLTLVVTPRDPHIGAEAIRAAFDFSNLDFAITLEIVETPVRTAAGKIRLLLPEMSHASH